MHFVFTYCSLTRISLPPPPLLSFVALSSHRKTPWHFWVYLVDIFFVPSDIHIYILRSSRVFLNFYSYFNAIYSFFLFQFFPFFSLSPLFAYFSLKNTIIVLTAILCAPKDQPLTISHSNEISSHTIGSLPENLKRVRREKRQSRRPGIEGLEKKKIYIYTIWEYDRGGIERERSATVSNCTKKKRKKDCRSISQYRRYSVCDRVETCLRESEMSSRYI